MNKTELIAKIAEKTAMSKKDVEKVLGGFLETVGDAMAAGDKVQLVGFGSFETKTRAARQGRNPRTNEVVEIAASTAPVFKAGKALKDKVNK